MSEQPLRAAIVPVTPLQQNCTLLWCTETMLGAFVDPGGDLPRLKAAAAQHDVKIEKILLTHGHIDHCGQAGILAQELAVPIEGPHEEDLSGSPGWKMTDIATALKASHFSRIATWSMATPSRSAS